MRSLLIATVIGLLGAAAQAHAAGGARAASPSQQEIDTGRLIYQQQCAACHGVKGEGKPGWEKRDALGELPPPPHDPTGHTWKHADAMLYKTIRDGWRDPFNKTKRLTMPAYKDTLSPHEIRSVISYLKTLWTPEQRRIQREEGKRHLFPPEAR
ncbi:MAG TPA: cytochrome c, class I [Oxalobacteraceae bacterium]|nr:cytochrome c, class I [Oxalobacteraceae bacterium]